MTSDPGEVLSKPFDWEEIPRWQALFLARSERVAVVPRGPWPAAIWLRDVDSVFGARVEGARFFRRRRLGGAPVSVGLKKQLSAPREPEVEQAWVEFVFQYPDGTPVSGLAYTLQNPAREKSNGELPANGTITRRNTPRGTYTVALAEVEGAWWQTKRRDCDDELCVVARTSGFADGTPAKLKLYHELREGDGEEIASFDATVQNDRVEVSFAYDYAADAQRKSWIGVVHLVAEITVQSSWAKTIEPLTLHLKTIDAVRWSSESVQEGETIDLLVQTRGFARATPVTIEVWRHDWSEGDSLLATRQVELGADRSALARCAYRSEGASISLDRPGEYYAIAKIQSSVERTQRSALVWCVHRATAAA